MTHNRETIHSSDNEQDDQCLMSLPTLNGSVHIESAIVETSYTAGGNIFETNEFSLKPIHWRGRYSLRCLMMKSRTCALQ